MTQQRLYLQCSLVNICLCSSFETSRQFGRGWQHHMWIHTDLWTQDALYLRQRNESEPEECGRIPAMRVSLEKTRNVGAVGRESYKFTGMLHARCVLLEKTHGIWKGFRDACFSWKKIRNPGAVGRGSYEFTVTSHKERKTHFNWENTRNLGGVVTAHIFHWKTQRFLRALAGVTCKFTVKMKPRRILHKKTQRFLGGWREWHMNLQSRWRPGAFYISPRSVGGLRRGYILDATQDLGLGWGGVGWWSRSASVHASSHMSNVQSATEWTASVHTSHMSTCDVTCVQSATERTALVHTSHMSKPVMSLVFKVLRNGLLRYILHTCPNLWCNSCSTCYGMDCFGTYFTHVQTCDVTRVQSATEWTASVHTSHMSKPVM